MRPGSAGYGRFLTLRRRVLFGGGWPGPVLRRRLLRVFPRGRPLPPSPESEPARVDPSVTVGESRVWLWRSHPGDVGEGETRTGSWELVPRAPAQHGAAGDARVPSAGGGWNAGCWSRRRISWRRSCPGFVWVLSTAGSSLRLASRLGARAFSVSASSFHYDQRKEFSSSEHKKLYFDTHALVRLLEENGFTTQQSEIIVSALVKIINSNMEVVYKDMVTKMQQEISLQQIMSHIASVKKDMIILEKSEFSALRTENEDEIVKLRADNKLGFNLEKSRVKEMYAENERRLLEIRSEIVELHAQQDRGLTQTNRKIDTEVAGLRTMLESHKLDTIKYLAGSVFTCLTIALGFYRLWI
ncbi:mitochondrial calcium uniporter regulator 1 isoform X2 [Microcaecilia unicolor]|uniref:Mitochondrial calcium uniporter regulator 1 isoform X2 n=1 Tax=Microcaecilia unicolor TaxID=1415580 RepID=A0A6P7YPZ7_9AMPH|nr:mitochondrial calcium uniporter regulator 1 isoform X2 [Microcaecilia unicolor]